MAAIIMQSGTVPTKLTPTCFGRVSTFARYKQFLAGMGLSGDETLATIDHMFN
ncbi:hypothetical protein SAMN05444959_105122 [Paracoccus seriniphilus]|uniref:Uncharacterized protein n=1 Tax=Paracoccus seriniphilus TaxID=184748 RepID=A0A239PVA7_9RHOB|nr:hypothetical protein [Paracoccus seriniphilus]WCR16474.1 hypothetical protein JHW44_18850 [Paracoccus seriniphilus]SNT73627.1 hypothetical protein SAMN05444959_105122 [Paracoccus seriniphilus]